MSATLTWIFIVAHAFIAGYSGHVAREQGFRFWQGLLLGLLLGPIALVILAIWQPADRDRGLASDLETRPPGQEG